MGNSRIKLGRCQGGRVLEHFSASPDDPREWVAVVRRWYGDRGLHVAVAGVHPAHLSRFREWAMDTGYFPSVIHSSAQLLLPINVDEPDRVGIDRLLGVLAASRRVEPGEPAVTVDVGTAVTVNLLTTAGAFGGGCILPGPWLMARALHEFTAKLPLVEPEAAADTIGRNTEAAIQAGIRAAVVGAVERVVGRLAAEIGRSVRVFVTGGGHRFLSGMTFAGAAGTAETDELMVLDGIRLAAEALP